jgi:virginiamycin A acetyltransferase
LKRSVKALVYAVAIALVSPWAACELVARRLAGRDVWFEFHGQFLGLLPGKCGQFLRNAYYYLTLQKCPLNCCFAFGTHFSHSETEVGERVYIGTRCVIGVATIGDDTMLADHVQILSGKHQHSTVDPDVPFQNQPRTFSRVTIGKNCWLGGGAVVMADIGENSVIGAGSVVVKSIPANSVAVGIPARVVRTNALTIAAADGTGTGPAR